MEIRKGKTLLGFRLPMRDGNMIGQHIVQSITGVLDYL